MTHTATNNVEVIQKNATSSFMITQCLRWYWQLTLRIMWIHLNIAGL